MMSARCIQWVPRCQQHACNTSTWCLQYARGMPQDVYNMHTRCSTLGWRAPSLHTLQKNYPQECMHIASREWTRPFQICESLFNSSFRVAQHSDRGIANPTNPSPEISRRVIVIAKEIVNSITACAWRSSCWLRILFLERALEDLGFNYARFAFVQIVLFSFYVNVMFME